MSIYTEDVVSESHIHEEEHDNALNHLLWKEGTSVPAFGQ